MVDEANQTHHWVKNAIDVGNEAPSTDRGKKGELGVGIGFRESRQSSYCCGALGYYVVDNQDAFGDIDPGVSAE